MFNAKRKIAELQAEYEARLAEQRQAISDLTERNRELEANLSEYRAKEKAIADSLIVATAEKEAAHREAEMKRSAEEQSRILLAKKCRSLLDVLLKKYPEESDVKEFDAFVSELETALGGDVALDEAAISLDEMNHPGADLEALCREMGLMEEE